MFERAFVHYEPREDQPGRPFVMLANYRRVRLDHSEINILLESINQAIKKDEESATD